MKRNATLLIVSLIFLFPAMSFGQGTITLSTYYPSPFGAYDVVKFVPHDVGANPIVCDASQEGLMFYDATEKALKICRDDGFGVLAFGDLLNFWSRDSANGYIY